MHVEELTTKASLEFLSGRIFGRLACVSQSQPYITPFSFAYSDRWFYGFGTLGKKIEWLRVNPLACIEVDEIVTLQEWTSIIVSARYQELTDTTENHAARELAYELLRQHQFWWEPGYSRTILQGVERPLDPIYYRLSVDEITGHRATPT